ncbi:MAG: pilus assembly protein PilP [Aquabacterium sp.]|jgi:type IV pilus assembly protein PilP|nr:pilus assembly protein PilP [Aquabacterium sp.]MBP8190314.1 pilus assembly protein PilP [Aquabacterium sp.]MDQ5926878.1 type pilus assembly protein PilP [Pseudomonadota bacterium]
MHQPRYKLLALLATLMLSACGGQHDELQAWMDQQRQMVKPNIQPLKEPQKFLPQAYAGMELEEPFSANKLTGALKNEAAQPNSAMAAELSRRKEPLEAFPLDAMSMVGSVNRKGAPYALLKVDELLYQVKVGDYVGQNYGKILHITETEVTLREIVQDAAGEWIERPTTLQLQEGGR